ncbi:gamma-glutamylcyclotransferase [Rhizobium sp. BK251]|uniref:gamma-glutamylcyclotransferase n=1 Tax=Rhizobium sp. BK251 TaxID=2512125 RepID=UPI0010DA4AFC|nr:gamma-glutamylcyclotransferase [Rhizobium sp. BK251]TCL69854.1 cation transport protein ChaC [Rhizobium sp. BK251]
MSKKRIMALTPELVRLCHRDEPKSEPDPRFTPLTDADYQQLSERLAASGGGDDLWVFAYGSLIWRPAFEAEERRRMTAYGWHRSFCIELQEWRGTPSQPGLMMALERGGVCDGVAYRLPKGDRRAQIERLLRRELSEHEFVPAVRWIPVQGTSGSCEVLSFWVGPTGQGISLRQPLETVAWIIARACGHAGSCAEYLYNTVLHLEEFGIRDRNLWRLQQLVADEIRLLYPH